MKYDLGCLKDMNDVDRLFKENMCRLGNLIKETRQARHMSLRALAATTRINPEFLKDIEEGVVNANFKSIYAIIRALFDDMSITLSMR